MKHTRPALAALLIALFTLFAFPAFAGACMRLCDRDFMATATAQDIQAEINKGADIGARGEDGVTLPALGRSWQC